MLCWWWGDLRKGTAPKVSLQLAGVARTSLRDLSSYFPQVYPPVIKISQNQKFFSHNFGFGPNGFCQQKMVFLTIQIEILEDLHHWC